MIFGPGFDQEWFASGFQRASVEKLQDLLGANSGQGGKKYPLFPPILFPDWPQSKNPRDVFLNPVLVKVSIFSHQAFAMQYTDKIQILKVILFGATSLAPIDGKNSGPKPAGIRWGLNEVTPGAIAFAAILVSIHSLDDPFYSH